MIFFNFMGVSVKLKKNIQNTKNINNKTIKCHQFQISPMMLTLIPGLTSMIILSIPHISAKTRIK